MVVGSIAKRYAKALVELASDEKNLAAVLAELDQIVKILKENDALTGVLTDPVATIAARSAILREVLDQLRPLPIVRNFLLLVLEKDRMGYIFDIYSYIMRISDALAGQTRASVKSARSLDEKAIGRIKSKLEEVTKRKVIIETEVDSSLIAGVITQLGDYVLDGSLRTQLDNIKENIKKG